MPARIVEIADAVAGAINSATPSLGLPQPAAARWLFERRLEALGTTTVDVVPSTVQREAQSRSATAQRVTVLVIVQKRAGTVGGAINDDDVDAVVALAQAIADHLDRRDVDGARHVATTHDPVAEPTVLAEHGLARSILALTYLSP